MALTPYEDIFRTSRFRDPFFTTSDGFRRHDWITRRYRDDRMVEIERKFDEMVRKVDSRFSGIFSLLDDEQLLGRKTIDVEHEGKPNQSKPRPFSLKIDVQDFQPEEVKVKVQGGQVFVHAKRENKNEGDGMYAYSFREFRKAFSVPKEIDIEKISSNLTSSGVLQIDAPVKGPSVRAIEGSVPVAVEHDK